MSVESSLAFSCEKYENCIINTQSYQFLITTWNEQLGPQIQCSFGNLLFNLPPEELQTLIENLFMTAVTIYGNELVINEPTIIHTPVLYISMNALLYFDSIPDKNVRGKQRFVMLSLLTHDFCNIISEKLKSIIKTNFQAFMSEKLDAMVLNALVTNEINMLISETRDQVLHHPH